MYKKIWLVILSIIFGLTLISVLLIKIESEKNDPLPPENVGHSDADRVSGKITIPNQSDPSIAIRNLIDNMSMDEKIGQMTFAGISGTEPDSLAERLVTDYKVGGIIFNKKNMDSPVQTVDYINSLKLKNQNNKLPLFFGIDQEGGRISKLPGGLINLPTNIEIGKLNNPSFSFEIGSVLAKLVSAYGFNINFAPVLDVNSNPENPIIGDRSFGKTTKLVSELGIQTLKGLQSERIIATIKHFPGHGDTSVDSHLELPTVNKSLKELEKLELIPFNRAVNEGADMVMIAHIMLPKIDQDYPSSLSKAVITELLRNKIGYDGVIITDDMTMKAITGNFDIGSAAVESIKAGSDIIMVAHDYEKMIKVISTLKKAVEDGEISEERIDESVTRILQLKEKYELDDTLTEKVNISKLNNLIKSVLDKYHVEPYQKSLN
ncbi:beta-N-acetylhexosaminidase [Bacillus marasmi]|uniref:beta-N-acetylhexosaminidase n=1 Tax=Bacillus marasmi TaxID=1926279 RepID=UPI001FE30309|nr:beta-N-acetylhexosaminidase [Bacillus marasmi]